MSKTPEKIMRWSSAISRERNGLAAAASVASELKSALQGEAPDLVFLFVHPAYGPNFQGILDFIIESLKPVCILGGTAGGVIGAGTEIEGEPAISAVAARLPRVLVTPFFVDADGLPGPDDGPSAWEQTLGIAAARKPSFVVIGSPGLAEIEDLLEGLDYAYPKARKVGGLASGVSHPDDPSLFLNGKVLSSGAVGVALSGDIILETLVAQGCRPIGQAFAVTGCDRNLLLELDGKRPVEILAGLFENAGEDERKLMNRALFLGVVMDPFKGQPPRAGDFLIRNVLGIDPGSKAVAVGSLLREGQIVQFHVRDADAAREDLSEVLKRYMQEEHQTQPAGALLFSCLGRGEHMYGEPDHDSRMFENSMGKIPVGGFFCNGEIGPVGGKTYIHGFTSSFGLFLPVRG